MKTTLVLTISSIFGIAAANAALINVNFIASNGGFAGQNQTGLQGVAGSGTDTWNQLTTGGSGLLDSTGAATSVGVSGLPGTGWGDTQPLSLLTASRAQFTKGQDTSMTISGLTPSSIYNLYLYSHNRNSAVTEMSYGTWSTTNATTSPSSQLIDARSNNNGSTFEEGVNYVLFENVVADASGEISFLGDADDGTDGLPTNLGAFDGDHRLHMNGFQIEEVIVAIPEPSSVALLGLGGLVLIFRRRK